MNDSEIGLAADRCWREEYGDQWWEKKQEWLAQRGRPQPADFGSEVAAAVGSLRGVFCELRNTLAENDRLRQERQNRLDDWAVDDAWAKLRGS